MQHSFSPPLTVASLEQALLQIQQVMLEEHRVEDLKNPANELLCNSIDLLCEKLGIVKAVDPSRVSVTWYQGMRVRKSIAVPEGEAWLVNKKGEILRRFLF